MRCYHCGGSLAEMSLPFGRLDECPQCQRQLHVCRMCVSYDPRETSKQCREDDAEEVRNKTSANFCDYFKPSDSAFESSGLAAEQQALKDAEALFRK